MTEPRTNAHETPHSRRTRASRSMSGTRPPRIGDALGPYRLCVEIGGGGMASVFLAQARQGRQTLGLPRFVALKCIRPDLATDPRFHEMFLDEARIAIQIKHANVCNVLDFDEHHGTYYLAMEFLSGQTLAAVQRQLTTTTARGATEPAGAALYAVFARILESVCEGLHAAHEATNNDGTPLHIVHRDVSPENLFVTYDGNVKVFDFGGAYAAERDHATRTGFLKGKCRYLAPEVLGGNKPDRRADIWALGVVAWEMLVQRHLFDQPNDLAILRAVGEMEIPPPSTLCPGLPSLLDEVVMRALERDPDKRYQTSREFGRALNRFLVEYGQVVGIAEISEFMHALFPEGMECTRQLLKLADRGKPAPRSRSVTSKQRATVVDAAVALELARRCTLPDGTPPGSPPTRADDRTPAPPPDAPASATAAPAAQVVTRWPRWAGIALGIVIVLVITSIAMSAVALARRPVERAAQPVPWFTTSPAPSGYAFDVAPAGTDESGAPLLRVQLVHNPEPAL